MRQTSIDCYNKIKQTDLLSKVRLRTYELLLNHGAMTGCEITEMAKRIYPESDSTNYHKRLSELREMGAIYEVRTRNCRIKGNNVIEWDLTDRVPIKLEKKKTKDQIIKDLQSEIVRLKEEIRLISINKNQSQLDLKFQ